MPWEILQPLFGMVWQKIRDTKVSGTGRGDDLEVNQVERLEKVAARLEKALINKEDTSKRIGNWVAIAYGGIAAGDKQRISSEATTPLTRALIRDTEVVVYIKGEAEIEKVQKMTATEIVELAKGPDGPNILAARKDIVANRRL